MIYKISVPAIVPDVEEIRILEWHGGVGDSFASGDLIVELETHKAIVEVRASQPGILRQILADVGNWQAIGRPLALLSDAADEPLQADPEAVDAMAVEFEIT